MRAPAHVKPRAAHGRLSYCQTEDVRYLTIVRHAKATPGESGESDYDRRLSAKGQRQCDELRAWALDDSQLGCFGPVTALVSSAKRTRETFQRAFEGTPFVSAVSYSDLIYNGRRPVSGEDLLVDVASIDPVTTSLLVVAHNPTVHDLVATLAVHVPESLRDGGYPLGGAFVFELRDDQPVGLARYALAAQFIPVGI